MAPILFVLLIFFFHQHVAAFPQYLTTTHCHVPMKVGVVMMGQTVIDSEKRSIKVIHEGKEVQSGEIIYSLSDVEVLLEPKMMHAAFEVYSSENDVRFDSGGCDGKIRAWKHGVLEYFGNSAISTNITIFSTWGSSANVYQAPPFSFVFSPPLVGSEINGVDL